MKEKNKKEYNACMDMTGMLYAVIVMVVWGLAAFWDKLAVNSLGGNLAAKMAILAWVPFLLIAGGLTMFSKKLGLNAEGVKWFFMSNLAWALASSLYYLVLSKMNLGLGSVLTALYPVVAVFLGITLLGESFSITKMIGIVMGLGAIVMIAL